MAINTKKVLKDQFSGYKGTGNFKMSKQEKKNNLFLIENAEKHFWMSLCIPTLIYNRDYGWFLPNKD